MINISEFEVEAVDDPQEQARLLAAAEIEFNNVLAELKDDDTTVVEA